MFKLDDVFFQMLQKSATESPRKRAHHNLHKNLDDPVQRLCIALAKGTYVRPHYHSMDNKWELIMALRGSVSLVIFDREGRVLENYVMGEGESILAVEVVPNTWHTVLPISDSAVIFEVKQGPYTPAKTSDFALWAPEEGCSAVPAFQCWLEHAKVGDRYSQETT